MQDRDIKVTLVDKDDNIIGAEEKLRAHEKGLLHRAFSIFVVNNHDEILLQKRASTKYHSPSLWSNTCCSHPAPEENLEEAAHKRLLMEMGFDCPLKWLFSFTYQIRFDNGLIEHEIDHVFLGRYNGAPLTNPTEVEEWKWEGLDDIKNKIELQPNDYTYWFAHIYPRFYETYHNLSG
jgi:isopentenyl-diphosphate delta-isomerase